MLLICNFIFATFLTVLSPDEIVSRSTGEFLSLQELTTPDEIPQIEGGLQAVRNVIKYPPNARMLRIEGMVIVSVVIDELGETKSVRVLKGNPIFTTSTVEAIKKLKFIPGKLKGKPVTSELLLPINYKLNN